MRLEKFDIVYAEFRPKNPQALRPWVRKYVGRPFKWQAMYQTHDGVNEWCFLVIPDVDHSKEAVRALPFAWVLQSDLQPCQPH